MLPLRSRRLTFLSGQMATDGLALLSSSCFCKSPMGSRVSHGVPLSTEIGIHKHHSHRKSVTSLWKGPPPAPKTEPRETGGPHVLMQGAMGERLCW